MVDAPKGASPPGAARSGLFFGQTTTTMAITAAVIAGGVGYYALYVKRKPEAYPPRVADPPPAARKYPDHRPSSQKLNNSCMCVARVIVAWFILVYFYVFVERSFFLVYIKEIVAIVNFNSIEVMVFYQKNLRLFVS